MWFLALWALGIISGIVHLYILGFPGALSEISRVLLLHQFVVTFGLVGIIGFIVNVAQADKTAKMLGWPGGPFQFKYGFSQVGLGIMGIMAIWFHGNFWIGVLVSMYIYGLSGLWSHTYVMIKNGKADADSVSNIIMDIIYQTFITVLSVIAGGIWIAG
ncbi:hypothetical protein QWJ34_12085 [Saccharibacillus sp. CPCC 101409]|uniref:DUF6790 family protein n=1 Tax=Saccharibacillus sp. CPCC 101409 TaxID=3058041 RepID=UPI002671B842|nr:DUF6790 family protein [Saccharibacillus sp. CPCC 101409]MDO3410501.1 hypothetical protein [Saccharibacillus sp. CPCC 101409]